MVYFSIKYIHSKRIFKRVSHFFYFSAVLEKSTIISRQELSLNYILKECLIFRKKADTVLITFIQVAPLKILMRYCIVFGTWTSQSSPSAPLYNHLRKHSSNCASLVALNFPSEYDVMCYYLIFHVSNFLISLFN